MLSYLIHIKDVETTNDLEEIITIAGQDYQEIFHQKNQEKWLKGRAKKRLKRLKWAQMNSSLDFRQFNTKKQEVILKVIAIIKSTPQSRPAAGQSQRLRRT